MSTSVFSLLVKRRFGPFFFTQFLGAFNDNVFRQALILLIASGVVAGTEVNTLNNVALALFILPFFLFSALAGSSPTSTTGPCWCGASSWWKSSS